MIKKSCIVFLSLFVFISNQIGAQNAISYYGNESNDLYQLLLKEGYKMKRHLTPQSAIKAAGKGMPVILTPRAYPEKDPLLTIDAGLLSQIQKKGLKVYLEYPGAIPGVKIADTAYRTSLERGVVTTNFFGNALPSMSLLAIHDAYILPLNVNDPLIVMARVVGFDRAEYGLADTKVYPLLFRTNNILVSTTGLSNFITGRYSPDNSVKQVWTTILSELLAKKVYLKHWKTDVRSAYSRTSVLPKTAYATAIKNGIKWFDNGRFYLHPGWKDKWLKYQGDGTKPIGPALTAKDSIGDGSMGIIEGHMSTIFHDGSQPYRYWMRADVQGEVAMALASAGNLLNDPQSKTRSNNLLNYLFNTSNFRAGRRNDPSSAAFGLIGWAQTHPDVFYGDDNARTILGAILASGYLNTGDYDKKIAEAIMANFRTTGRNGFRGSRMSEEEIVKNGWKHFYDRDLVHLQAHYESWMWACYLWLYDKTKYQPLLDRTKNALKMMMEACPKNWLWGSSLQMQRVRMLLPLSWLVRVENTAEHRAWLDRIFMEVLRYQDESGAIREEIGEGKGEFRALNSNSDYGLDEGSLIFRNGDKVSDQLYACNFAVFGMHEAYLATGKKEYLTATRKLSDYLVRIQVKSDKHESVDGAWFRAFDYGRWDYWGSNSDVGWGVWCTLTGWIQSWIVTTLVQIEQRKGFWEVTSGSGMNKAAQPVIRHMMDH